MGKQGARLGQTRRAAGGSTGSRPENRLGVPWSSVCLVTLGGRFQPTARPAVRVLSGGMGGWAGAEGETKAARDRHHKGWGAPWA